MTPKGLSGRDRAGPVLSLVQSTQVWEGSGEGPFSPSSSRQKGRSGSAQQDFRVQVCTLFLCRGLGWMGIWKLALFGKGPAALGEIPRIPLL